MNFGVVGLGRSSTHLKAFKGNADGSQPRSIRRSSTPHRDDSDANAAHIIATASMCNRFNVQIMTFISS